MRQPPNSRLRERRTKLGLSQEHLARRAGCSTNTIRLVEHGYRVSDDMLGRIAAALEVDVPDIWLEVTP